MNKPNNFDNTQRYTASNPLPAGAYVCKVIDIAEMQSRTGKPMVKVALEIEEGDFKGYFKQRYDAKDDLNKKWPCVMYQLTEDNEGNCSRGFKTLIDLLEEDNKGFQIEWGENFCKSIKGKLIGINFRREEWEWSDRTGWNTKPFSVVSIEDIRAGKVKPPKDKPLANKSNDIPEDFEEIDAVVPF